MIPRFFYRRDHFENMGPFLIFFEIYIISLGIVNVGQISQMKYYVEGLRNANFWHADWYAFGLPLCC